MPTSYRIPAYLLLFSTVLVTGCAPVNTTIAHTMPPAVPLADNAVPIRISLFTVKGSEDDRFGPLATEIVTQHMDPYWHTVDSQSGSAMNVLKLGGNVSIETTESSGARIIRLWDRQAKALRDETVETLVRNVDVEVHFVVRSHPASVALATIETRRSYSSSGDPRVRGELGLNRLDDPQLVPPADDIITKLITECAEEFWDMVTPLKVSRQETLRPAPGSESSAGLASARAGNMPDAMTHFSAAAETDPTNGDLRFNLGVAAEASGKLPQALAAYLAAVELSDGQDVEAEKAAQIVTRAIGTTTIPEQ